MAARAKQAWKSRPSWNCTACRATAITASLGAFSRLTSRSHSTVWSNTNDSTPLAWFYRSCLKLWPNIIDWVCWQTSHHESRNVAKWHSMCTNSETERPAICRCMSSSVARCNVISNSTLFGRVSLLLEWYLRLMTLSMTFSATFCLMCSRNTQCKNSACVASFHTF